MKFKNVFIGMQYSLKSTSELLEVNKGTDLFELSKQFENDDVIVIDINEDTLSEIGFKLVESDSLMEKYFNEKDKIELVYNERMRFGQFSHRGHVRYAGRLETICELLDLIEDTIKFCK